MGHITIELKQLRFFAYHGLYAEERQAGNEFEVDVAVSFQIDHSIITRLEDSINYVRLHELVKTEMQNPRDLLETFVMELAESIGQNFSNINKVVITLTKLHAPIIQFTGKVSVSYIKNFNAQ